MDRQSTRSATTYGWRLALAVAVVSCLAASGHAVPSEPPRVRTDRAVYPPPPAPKLPKAGGTFTDPTFGTRLMRVTDETDGPDNITAYSYWPTFNKDSTLLHLCRNGEPTLYRFDPHAFRLGDHQPLYPKAPPAGGNPGWEDAIWSGKEADVLYCHNETRLWRYRPLTGEYTLVRDFRDIVGNGFVRQMSMSRDDQVFGFSIQDASYKVI
jgi:hypothetical protein